MVITWYLIEELPEFIMSIFIELIFSLSPPLFKEEGEWI
jgi:hypothetical protein